MSTTRSYTASIPAETCSLKALRAFFGSVLEQAGCADPEPVILALDEACSNVIRYRCKTIDDGTIQVTAEVNPRWLRFRIGRFCKPEDIQKIKPRDLTDVRPGGLGTSFIEQIMDRVEYEPDPVHPDCLALILERSLKNQS
jgi:anti-sigma regulatory factor (Ser/Thr protein kinase)